MTSRLLQAVIGRRKIPYPTAMDVYFTALLPARSIIAHALWRRRRWHHL